ncbi:MAG: tripartite tricarboxylate transporter substrate-binding protein [Proteobacteria bacterium]|nr:tripartite tricarboxylate transporter substrate-binding protein [Pseudomonadota bacterium]
MTGQKTIGAIAALGMIATAAASTSVRADEVADFYKGNTVTVIVGFGAGGGYGTFARLIGQHMGQYLPGKPNFVPQFMPGGGSLKMANYMYNIAPKNGTFIGLASPVLPVFQLIRSKGFKMDVRRFSYIGRMASQKHVMMVRADTGVTSIDDIKKKEITAAASGKGSPTFIFPKMMNEVLGTKFKVITGYKGSAGSRLALEQGEAKSMTSGWVSWKANSPHWIKSKFLIPVVELGLDKSPDLPKSVPLILDLAKNDADRDFIRFMMGPTVTGWSLFGPPNIPKARLAALRTAYDKMVRDPAFLREAKKRRLEIEPMSGVEIAKRVNATASASPAIVKRAKAALGYK